LQTKLQWGAVRVPDRLRTGVTTSIYFLKETFRPFSSITADSSCRTYANCHYILQMERCSAVFDETLSSRPGMLRQAVWMIRMPIAQGGVVEATEPKGTNGTSV
jgi:hypothetical protein